MRLFFLALAWCAVAPASAAVVVSENFDTENNAVAAANFDGFTVFKTERSPFGPNNRPDLVFENKCVGGTGGCVVMKAASFLTTRQSFDFVTGDRVSLSIKVAGSAQTAIDRFEIGFRFPTDTAFTDFQSLDAFEEDYGPLGSLDAVTTQVVSSGLTLAGTRFRTFTVSFTAAQAGTVQPIIYSLPIDNPLIDDFLFTVDNASAVPEPTTWAMMLIGFSLLAAWMRAAGRTRTGALPLKA